MRFFLGLHFTLLRYKDGRLSALLTMALAASRTDAVLGETGIAATLAVQEPAFLARAAPKGPSELIRECPAMAVPWPEPWDITPAAALLLKRSLSSRNAMLSVPVAPGPSGQASFGIGLGGSLGAEVVNETGSS